MIATLAGEPWCMPLREIGQLTRWQIKNILFHPREKSGAVRRRPPTVKPYNRARELFHILHVLWNLPTHIAARMVREQLAAEAQSHHGKDR